MTAVRIESVKLDIEELRRLEGLAVRQRVKDHLSVEVRKFETELMTLQDKLKSESNAEGNLAVASTEDRPKAKPTCYTVRITNYAWDQSDKFVKIYITLKNVQTVPAENITSQYTATSMEITVNALDGKNHTLVLGSLMSSIVPDGSYFKVKSDMLVVFMKKGSSQHWSHLTSTDKKTKEPKVPKQEEGGDPSKGLMDMMKQMYEDGDDEMKRTIAKAWTESRDKQGGQGGQYEL